jgi:outer membrane protein TolC
VDLTRVEDARVQYYSILQSIADVRILRLRNRVALYRSLGGSFDDQPSVTTAASDG